MRLLSKNISGTQFLSLPNYHPPILPHVTSLLSAVIVTYLDYYSNLLSSLPASKLVPPQSVLSRAARGIQLIHKGRSHHSKPPMGVAFRSLPHLPLSSPLRFLISRMLLFPHSHHFSHNGHLSLSKTHQPLAFHRDFFLAVLSAWDALPQMSTWLFLSPPSSCCSIVIFSVRSSQHLFNIANVPNIP